MNRLNKTVLILVSVLLSLQMSSGIAASPWQGKQSLAPMLETVTPAVVNIRVTKAVPTTGRYFFRGEEIPNELRRFLPDTPDLFNRGEQNYSVGAGSGVIIDSTAGYVVTNHHVVNDANEISVQLADGRVLDAELLGSDASTDVALLQVAADDLVDVELADIDSVRVGDFVVAIGNPFGIGQTVTSGIVSALGRTGLNNDNYEDFIQTDAAINVGNSGGALIDMEGRLIGINTAIISGDGGNNGIGFAVPVDMVAAVVDHLQRDGEVRRGMLGVTITSVTPSVKEALNVEVDKGALVTSVLPGSAAEKAGIQISDVIVAIDGEPVESGRDLRNHVGLLSRNQEVELALLREGESLSVNAIIGDANGIAAVTGDSPAQNSNFRGALLRNMQNSDDYPVDSGIVVDSVNPQSRAAVAGLRPGDVIIEVNRQQVENLQQFNEVVGDSGRFTAITVVRNEGRALLLVP
jgi:serine protease DegQ